MRTFFWFLFCVLVIGGALGMHLQKDQDAAQAALLVVQQKLSTAKTALAERKRYHDTLKLHYETQRQIYESNMNLGEARSVLEELQSTIESQKRIYAGIVESRRNAAKGKEIEMIELADGRVFRKATVLGFDDTQISILTPQGIQKISAQELPPNLKEYFRLDLIEPEILESLGGLFSKDGQVKTVKKFRYSVPSLAPVEGQMSVSEKQREIASNIQAVAKRINEVQRMKQAPLTGMDGLLKTSSTAYKHRKKARDEKYDREIRALNAQRDILIAQQSHLARLKR